MIGGGGGGGGRKTGSVTLMAEVGRIKHEKSTEKKAIYECRQKIMI